MPRLGSTIWDGQLQWVTVTPAMREGFKPNPQAFPGTEPIALAYAEQFLGWAGGSLPPASQCLELDIHIPGHSWLCLDLAGDPAFLLRDSEFNATLRVNYNKVGYLQCPLLASDRCSQPRSQGRDIVFTGDTSTLVVDLMDELPTGINVLAPAALSLNSHCKGRVWWPYFPFPMNWWESS